MKEINLHNGGTALVDDEDYERVINFPYNWFLAGRNKRNGASYALAYWHEGGRRRHIAMHRFILGISDEHVFIDHADRNPLNNCKNNLRIATRAQNQWNRAKFGPKNSASEYKGAYRCGKDRWRSSIIKHGKKYHLGGFDNEIEAAKAYDRAARELHGEFACVNFPDETVYQPTQKRCVCGQPITGRKKYCITCARDHRIANCRAFKAKERANRENSRSIRRCDICGTSIEDRNIHAKFCESCRAERERQSARRHHLKQDAGRKVQRAAKRAMSQQTEKIS